MKRLCVFCGSNRGANVAFAKAVQGLGDEIVRRKMGLVYGGGGVGLMGVVADTVLDAGGEVIGVLPKMLGTKEVAHARVEDIRLVGSMHERKHLMAELSDGFIAAPGGFGTLEELLEQLTWLQLGMHDKPCGVLNVDGFFDPLLAFLDRATDQRFIREQHRASLLVSTDPGDLIDQLTGFEPSSKPKWLDSEDLYGA